MSEQQTGDRALMQLPEKPIRLDTLDDVVRFAEIAFKSGIFQDIKNANQAIVKILLGRELGFGALASLRGIMFDDRGAITLMANLQAAALRRAGYDWNILKLDDSACELEISRAGRVVGVSSLTIKQAADAKMNMQWSSKDSAWKEKVTWRSYPRNMLFARCISNGVKWFAPEVTNGVTVYDPDELTPAPDVIDGTSAPVQPQQTTEPQKQATQEPPKDGTSEVASSSTSEGDKPPVQTRTAELYKIIESGAKKWANKGKEPNEQQIKMGFLLLKEACGSDESKRHTIQAELTGFESWNDIPGPYVIALIDWLHPWQDRDEKWHPDKAAIHDVEIVVRESLIAAGQQTMPIG